MSEITFKTYGELEISEGLTESSHVIIEENGDVKRFPANSIGKVKTVNGAEPDENGNVAIEIKTESTLDENGKLLNSVLPDGYPMKTSVTETLLQNETVPDGGLNTSDSIGLEVGKAYTVIWDDVEYPDLIAYQNDYLISLPSSLPFKVNDCPEDGFCDIIPSDGATHTITIMAQSSTIVPMSKDYLPKATAVADVTAAPTMEDFNNLLTVLRNAGYLATE